jgi:AcrR family transcriptional regulator
MSTTDRRKAATGALRQVARRPRRTRGEKSEFIREQLFRAAAEVVGEVGYAGASITLITQRAGVAQGTFYNYFESRQDLLDKLLPSLGLHMLDHIRRSALRGPKSFAELEKRSFAAFFSFLQENPHFLRILNEAESYAPIGYQRHIEVVSKGYVRFLGRSLRNGDLPAFTERDLEPIAFILMAARGYLAARYLGKRIGRRSTTKLPSAVVDTYMKFVLHGFQGTAPGALGRLRDEGTPGR